MGRKSKNRFLPEEQKGNDDMNLDQPINSQQQQKPKKKKNKFIDKIIKSKKAKRTASKLELAKIIDQETRDRKNREGPTILNDWLSIDNFIPLPSPLLSPLPNTTEEENNDENDTSLPPNSNNKRPLLSTQPKKKHRKNHTAPLPWYSSNYTPTFDAATLPLLSSHLLKLKSSLLPLSTLHTSLLTSHFSKPSSSTLLIHEPPTPYQTFHTSKIITNPFEKLSQPPPPQYPKFISRSALKLANLDRSLDFKLTRRIESNATLNFIDICSAPGGFSEYVFWRRRHAFVEKGGKVRNVFDSEMIEGGYGDGENRRLQKRSVVVDSEMIDCDGDGDGDDDHAVKQTLGWAMSLVGENDEGTGADWKGVWRDGVKGFDEESEDENEDEDEGEKIDEDGEEMNPFDAKTKIGPSEIQRFRISTGEDGTGDIYNSSNILSFWSQIESDSPASKGKVSLSLADGGTDIMRDSPDQASKSLRLLSSQIVCSLGCLEKGGTFVLKYFGLDGDNGVKDAFKLCFMEFDEVKVFKPVCSRPASAERYIVGLGFKGLVEEVSAKVFFESNNDSSLLSRIWCLGLPSSSSSSSSSASSSASSLPLLTFDDYLNDVDYRVLELNVKSIDSIVNLIDLCNTGVVSRVNDKITRLEEKGKDKEGGGKTVWWGGGDDAMKEEEEEDGGGEEGETTAVWWGDEVMRDGNDGEDICDEGGYGSDKSSESGDDFHSKAYYARQYDDLEDHGNNKAEIKGGEEGEEGKKDVVEMRLVGREAKERRVLWGAKVEIERYFDEWGLGSCK